MDKTLPRILLLSTGGTIAGVGNDETSAGYVPGKLTAEDLLKNIPPGIAVLRSENISSVGSYDLEVMDLVKMANRINEIYDNDEADGIVITHGTDTMEETSYFLSLTIKSRRPVVLTGAMRAATALSADGPKNLLDAILVACDSKSNGKGVVVCFNERIYDGRNVVKVNTTNLNAFASPNSGPIGQVYNGNVFYYNESLKQNNSTIPFPMGHSLAKVEIAYMYLGAGVSAISAFIKEKVDGIVIAGTGDGSLSKPFLEAAKRAIKEGIVVVRSTRVPSGRVSTFHQVFDDEKLGTISAGDLNPQKARILLMLALTVTRDLNRIRRIFIED